MYAIIRAGGKQLKVSKKDNIKINKVPGKKGDKIEFDQVLLIRDKETVVGTPLIDNAKVTGVIVAQTRGKKILVGRHKRRKDYQKINGFRADLTEICIENIKK